MWAGWVWGLSTQVSSASFFWLLIWEELDQKKLPWVEFDPCVFVIFFSTFGQLTITCITSCVHKLLETPDDVNTCPKHRGLGSPIGSIPEGDRWTAPDLPVSGVRFRLRICELRIPKGSWNEEQVGFKQMEFWFFCLLATNDKGSFLKL